MILFCAYCKTTIGQREPLADKRVTHGACDDCLDHLLREIEATAPEDVTVIAESHATKATNSRAPIS